MEYEIVCERLCDDIAQLLLSSPGKPSLRATYAAARATEDLSAAFHRAAGNSHDRLWSDAIASVDHFLDLCDQPGAASSMAMLKLRRFVWENADLLPSGELKAAG